MEAIGERLTASEYIKGLPEPIGSDAARLDSLFQSVTGHTPVLWGPSVVGYGQSDPITHPKSAAEGFEIGFSIREGRFFLYLRRYLEHYEQFLEGIGETAQGKACLSFASLDGVDVDALRDLIEYAWHDRSRADDETDG